MRDYIQEAHEAQEQFQVAIERIANDRLGLCLLELEYKLKGSLKIVFGMGTEAIFYRGHQCHYYDDIVWDTDDAPKDAWSVDGEELFNPEELTPLKIALDDITTITNGYRLGCPDDISV